MFDKRPLAEVMQTTKSCMGIMLQFCFEGTQEEGVHIMEGLLAYMASRSIHVISAEPFCFQKMSMLGKELKDGVI